MANSKYYIGANDEHGLNPPTIGKRTPVMPYLNRSIYENQFNRPTKNYFIQACLRQGFDVFDVKPEITDTPVATRVARVNRQGLTLLVTYGYNAYGAGNAFNSASGISVFYSPYNAQANDSKILSEEVYEQLINNTNQRGRGVSTLTDIGMLDSVNCAATLVEPGFMTNLDEAKLMIDCDYQVLCAEQTCNGVCRYLGIVYRPRVIENYPTLRLGSSGKMVMYLQFALYNYGYNIDIDGLYGTATESVVKQYQQENSLAIDGIAGDLTWKTILFLPPYPTLQQGAQGTYVWYLQTKLEAKLYPVGVIDGVFGVNTATAVKQFQLDNNLSADSIVGPNTWQLLSAIGGGRD